MALRACVVHSFAGASSGDPSYVLGLASSGARLAVAGSEFDLALYDRTTLQRVCELGAPAAHAGRINEVGFCDASAEASSALYSASSDGTVRVWDCGARVAAATLRERAEEVWSASAGAEHALAVGTQSAVLLWDLRRAARPVRRWEVHTDAVTQVRLQPGGRSVLSGSVDGLLCVIDAAQADEEEAVVCVCNTEAPVAAAGFLGGAAQARAAPRARRGPRRHVCCRTPHRHTSPARAPGRPRA